MPIFKCPKCNREGYIAMAFCDEVLHKLTWDADHDKCLVDCVECESDAQTLTDPVKWRPPNLQFRNE